MLRTFPKTNPTIVSRIFESVFATVVIKSVAWKIKRVKMLIAIS